MLEPTRNPRIESSDETAELAKANTVNASVTEPSAAQLWQAAARRATDGQLVASAMALPLVSIAAVFFAFFRPPWAAGLWPLVALPMIVGSFGLWGIADRELTDCPASTGLYRTVRVIALAMCICSAAVLFVWVMQLTIGRWKS